MNLKEYIKLVEAQKFLSKAEKALLIQAYEIGYNMGKMDGLAKAQKILMEAKNGR